MSVAMPIGLCLLERQDIPMEATQSCSFTMMSVNRVPMVCVNFGRMQCTIQAVHSLNI